MADRRIAIYARYSSDLQNPSSIADQISLCRDLVKRQFGVDKPTAVFEDAARSGASLHDRPGLEALMAGAESKAYDMVVAEGLDRLSRSMADIAHIYRLLQYAGVSIWTAHEGEVSDLHVGFKGTMNAMYLRDMKDKVRRAHRARAEEGRSPAAICYGYRAVRGVLDERGRYVNGLREIHEGEAEVVRRIFQDYAEGMAVKALARTLNDEGIASPSGRKWVVNSILGAPSRQQGILNNELYRGWLVYNRTRKVVDPKTGRARYEVNPESKWQRTRVPHLQIVSDELWDRAARRRGKRMPIDPEMRETDGRRRKHTSLPASNRRPLTGLVKCGWCGGEKGLADRLRYVCNNKRYYKNRCRNARGTQAPAIAERMFEELFEYVRVTEDWPERMEKHFGRHIAERRKLEEEAVNLEQRIARLLDAVEHGIHVDTAAERITPLQKRLDEIQALPRLPTVPDCTEAIRNRLTTALNRLELQFWDERQNTTTRRLLSNLVDEIVLTPVKGQRSGEVVDVRLKRGGWPEFYCEAAELWPEVIEV